MKASHRKQRVMRSLSLFKIMGLFRTSCSRYRSMIGTGYVEIIRNIPVLVWIFLFYYFIGDRLLPAIGIGRTTFTGGSPPFEVWITILAIYLRYLPGLFPAGGAV